MMGWNMYRVWSKVEFNQFVWVSYLSRRYLWVSLATLLIQLVISPVVR